MSDNGDRNKILATIADVVKVYTEKYSDRLILFRVVQQSEPGFTEWLLA
jgi:hypothetical protein